jgi:hypothetical protein
MSKQGLIYEIVCNVTSERYIGSTFEPTVARRITVHRWKKNECCSKQIIDRGNYTYGLLETIFVNSRDELRMCERKWYDQLDCINKQRPYCSLDELKEYKKEYREQNRDNKKEQQKVYYQQNRDKLNEKQKAYYEQNKNEIKEYKKEYYKQNRDKKKAYNKIYREHLNIMSVKSNS